MWFYNLLIFRLKYSSEPIILFGASTLGKRWFNYLVRKGIKINFFCDNSEAKWGSEFCGVSVISPEEVVTKYRNSKVLITSFYYKEIKNQLKAKGKKKIYNFSKFIDDKESQSFWILIKNYFFGRFFINYPTVVNFPITGKCNLKCIMCNVWRKQNQHKNELSAQDIGNIFSQKLFCKVTHVGLSGGEPFLRKDIEEIVKAIIDNTPSLKSISIITNGTIPNIIIEKVKKIEELCKNNNLHFSLLVSVDGVNEIHNRNRGDIHCFERVKDTLLNLKNINLNSLSLCCTITKINVYHLYEILDFAKDIGIHIKFRIAAEIDRLYNNDLIGNFDFNRKEKIKIAKFFDKLSYCYENNLVQNSYYQSAKNQILFNEPRMSGCNWKQKGISIDAEGNLYYCFVKSPKVGNILNGDGWHQYKKNIKVRESIKRKHCNSCIHDYTGDIDLEIYLKKRIDSFIKRIEVIKSKFEMLWMKFLLPYLVIKNKSLTLKKPIKKIFITGWYGTETTGDKAILAGIIQSFRKYDSSINFVISSLFPYYTEETISELELSNVNVVLMNSQEEKTEIKKSDLVVMGGGPLMDIVDTEFIFKAFVNAINSNVPTLIYSCGLGPLRISKIRKIVRNTLRLSHYIYFRDQLSTMNYPELVKRLNYQNLIDPAVIFLQNYKPIKTKNSKRVLFCLRDWPRNYTNYENEMDYIKSKELFTQKISSFIDFLLKEEYQVGLFPMNTFFAGKDDRDYFRDIKKYLGSNRDKVLLYNDEYTVQQTIATFMDQDLVIGMRFHSVVFGTMLGIPTIALEYNTDKGKVYGYMKDIKMENYCIMIKDFINNSECLFEVFNYIQENWTNTIDKLREVKKNMDYKVDLVTKDIINGDDN